MMTTTIEVIATCNTIDRWWWWWWPQQLRLSLLAIQSRRVHTVATNVGRYQILLWTLMCDCLFLCICLWLSVLSVLSNTAPNVDGCLFGSLDNYKQTNGKHKNLLYVLRVHFSNRHAYIFCRITIKWRDLLELKSMFQLSFKRFKFQITWPEHWASNTEETLLLRIQMNISVSYNSKLQWDVGHITYTISLTAKHR